MFAIFCKRLQISVTNKSIVVSESISHLGFPKKPLFVSYFSSSSSLAALLDEQKRNFTVSYLVKSCGLSLERATFASKKVHFETPERPDLVVNLLKNHGFTNAHISKLVMGKPLLLLSDPEKTLLPKLQFFGSKGLSDTECAHIISSCPSILLRSIENHLMPIYDFLKKTLVMDEKVATALKRWPRLLCQDAEKNLAPNLGLLREIGVPQPSISLLMTTWPGAAFLKHSKFDEIVKEVKDMGFDPFKSKFVHAIRVLIGMKKVNRENKFEVYGRWGWSKDETLLAFKMRPLIMIISEYKITKVMDFLINKMGWPSTDIARNPLVLCFSLEKRIIPRCSVVQILLSKGLIKKDLSVSTFLGPVEKFFLERYVTKFQKRCPQLLSVYQRNGGSLGRSTKESDLNTCVYETVEAS
jgi:mTERF domain-containing protein